MIALRRSEQRIVSLFSKVFSTLVIVSWTLPLDAARLSSIKCPFKSCSGSVGDTSYISKFRDFKVAVGFCCSKAGKFAIPTLSSSIIHSPRSASSYLGYFDFLA